MKKVGRQSAANAEQTRGTILREALNLFSEQGYSAVSLRAIGERAGVSHSLLRHHFGSKLNIWKQVSDNMHEHFRDYIYHILDDIDAQLPAPERLYQLLIRMVAGLLSDPRPLQLLKDAVSQEGEMLDHLFNDDQRIHEQMESLFIDTQKLGLLTEFQLKELKWMMISWAHAATSLTPLLEDSVGKTGDQAQLRHWQIFASVLALKFGLSEQHIPKINDLEDLAVDCPCPYD
ncbi:TetR/AcrR family transcriptional regulator [Aliagarivorans marinus]|uniref:TetR/AcrR family transcriptional regulator n=1 Tax=Aliagarivorans marinus TaxID=561965 RepID=UPI00041D6B7F|nr:TetR/AcrR family transcriptional regulator [Aliagarivorans marinus]